MKIGIKIWRVTDRDMSLFIKKAAPDFIETMAIEGEDYSKLKDYGLPVTIHCEHSRFGVNFSNPILTGKNRKAVRFAIRTADLLDAETIVLHPGYYDNPGCSQQVLMEFLKSVFDGRLVIENMPTRMDIGKDVMNFGDNTGQISEIMAKTGLGFCLDIPHVVAAAACTGKSYKQMIKDFMKLNPRYFHMSDTIPGKPMDEHLHLGKGKLDINALKRMFPKDAWVALETPIDAEGTARDVEIMKS